MVYRPPSGVRDSKADVSSVSPSSERIKEPWVVCGLYTEISATLLVGAIHIINPVDKNKLS